MVAFEVYSSFSLSNVAGAEQRPETLFHGTQESVPSVYHNSPARATQTSALQAYGRPGERPAGNESDVADGEESDEESNAAAQDIGQRMLPNEGQALFERHAQTNEVPDQQGSAGKRGN